MFRRKIALLVLLTTELVWAQQAPGQWKDSDINKMPGRIWQPSEGSGLLITKQRPGNWQPTNIEKDAEIVRLQKLVEALQQKILLLEQQAALLEGELRKSGRGNK